LAAAFTLARGHTGIRDQVSGVSIADSWLVTNGMLIDARGIQIAMDFGNSDIAGRKLKRLIHGGVFPGFRHTFSMADLFAIPLEVSTHLIVLVTIVTNCSPRDADVP